MYDYWKKRLEDLKLKENSVIQISANVMRILGFTVEEGTKGILGGYKAVFLKEDNQLNT